ncbi:MAG: putative lactoylglutathione lyase [Bacteriovoracaceae bacterium]|jgi:predicted lactoylglutathione lyase
MQEANTQTHINQITLRSIDLTESEAFFDIIFKHLGLEKKDVTNNKSGTTLSYWGAFGLMITEQKDMLVHLEPYHRPGIVRLSVRVGTRKLINDLFEELKELNYKFAWEPKDSQYAEGYYSVCLLDPDENEFEIVYID